MSVQQIRGTVNDRTGRVVMGGEDFAFYSQKTNGCFVVLGVNNPEKGCIHNVHTPQFKVDEDALPLGTALHVSFALESLNE